MDFLFLLIGLRSIQLAMMGRPDAALPVYFGLRRVHRYCCTSASHTRRSRSTSSVPARNSAGPFAGIFASNLLL